MLPWQRHWRCLWPSVGSDSGNYPAPGAASTLYLLGHPGHQLPSTLISPKTLIPEARLAWDGWNPGLS